LAIANGLLRLIMLNGIGRYPGVGAIYTQASK